MKIPVKNIFTLIQAAIFVMMIVFCPVARGDDADTTVSPDMAAESGEALFTDDELDDMLAPIALYPDPLIAQILPAATFSEQIDEAARYVKQYGAEAQIDSQPWDVSVKAIAHYPDILFMMDKKFDWMVALGQAFVEQQQDVMASIQRLRARAAAAGNLNSTSQQQVVRDENAISVVPADPEIIYIPRYDPDTVFVTGFYPAYGFIDFGIGFTIGAWLNRDLDWRHRRIFYHGWRGGGWINRSRPHVRIRNNVYINRNNVAVTINRRVRQHDTVRYRENLRHDVQIRRERGAPFVPRGRDVRPPERIERRDVPQNRIAPDRRLPQNPVPGARGIPVSPAVKGTPAPPPAANKDSNRGRGVSGGESPPAYTGYGGYGSRKDAATFRERGQASRENMRQFNRQRPPVAPGLAPAPLPRPSHPGGLRPSAPSTGRQAPGPAAEPKPGRLMKGTEK